jgi:transcriptional regulator with XRE-family HTH domain
VVKISNQIDRRIGVRLRHKRISLGWSREELAAKLEISLKDLIAYETGARRINADLLLLISETLGVRPADFFLFEGEAPVSRRRSSDANLSNQGLRLHRAFVGVKSWALREAIVSLVIEIAKKN